jgi:hypothetical protein
MAGVARNDNVKEVLTMAAHQRSPAEVKVRSVHVTWPTSMQASVHMR